MNYSYLLFRFFEECFVKTRFYASGLVAVLGLFSSQAVLAYDGVITFEGEITANTCVVKLNDSDDGTGTVTLPTISANHLSEAEDVAGLTAFTIDLSGCVLSDTTTVSTYFEPGTYVNAAGRLALLDTSEAEKVEIQLLNSKQEKIVAGALQSEQKSTEATMESGDTEASLSYYAQYYATGAIKAGKLSSEVSYTIVYD